MYYNKYIKKIVIIYIKYLLNVYAYIIIFNLHITKSLYI